MTLYIDFETRSRRSLPDCGVHVYAADPSTEVLCAVIADEKTVWHLRTPSLSLPPDLATRIMAGERVVAHNVHFEAAIIKDVLSPRFGWPDVDVSQYDDTLARCAVMALPLGLDAACKALGLAYQKDQIGRRLMLKMTKPKKDGTWHFSHTDLLRLNEYCEIDVLATRELDKHVRPLTPSERTVWETDFAINCRGVAIDTAFVEAAILRANEVTASLNERMAAVTGSQVPSVTAAPKLKDWAKRQGVAFPTVVKRAGQEDEYEAETSDKQTLTELLKDETLPEAVREAFSLRLEGAKSSVRKLVKFRDYASVDGRARGNLQYHAAGTGRWGGRGIQLQNVPRSAIDFDGTDLGTADLPTISKMLRGCLIAAPGKKLVWGDYSAVEARGVVWAAKQNDIVDVFKTGSDVYKHMAGLIFNKPTENITKDERFIGKTSVLGCGYGVGPQKFQAQCGRMGHAVTDDLAKQAVGGWREANHKVVSLWKTLETSARTAILSPSQVFPAGPFAFRTDGPWLKLRLPSGRLLWYHRPHLTDGKYGKVISYWGISSYTKQWTPQTTWGGSLLNNAVQGMCRDFTANAMVALGDVCVLSVHDEIICETERDFPVDRLASVMSYVPAWAAGFPLKAEVDEGQRYGK